ncbi:DUF1190 domain-containing protein [Fulvimarina sp. 2208YS6-2-32]|uniref:DUF1190 domain-containing protein n=1 Tax=Fulvimarina uroteuthidis TaxID=3098149 RepID=A0ABU5I5M6_9HYPH|nr:DUF1190 domain-containing protein [Fulvimarina sp. 2208YS6-2-32]MDY8110397.1 DUF1190 domain-containing protein [Fulvimarina sp. 2208YS6-2-32]
MRKRKIGSHPPLLALGTIAATGLVLSGCGEEPATDAVFNTPTECASSGVDLEICEAEYQQALQQHLSNAPRFDGQAACEAEYGEGRCLDAGQVADQQGANNGGSGSFFIPFMTGYLVSSAIGNLASYAAYRNYRSSPSYNYSSPIYTNRAGQTVTSAVRDGQRISRPVNVNTRTVSRSGFGGRSTSRGGFFGG